MFPRPITAAVTASLAGALVLSAVPGASAAGGDTTASVAGEAAEYVVLFEHDADEAVARGALAAAGGEVVSVNTDVGYAVVSSTDAGFAAAATAAASIQGVARERSIGAAPDTAPAREDDVERLTAAEREQAAATYPPTAPAPTALPAAGDVVADPLADRQWDMRAIGATPEGSYAVERGSRAVSVGIIDTGVDGSHPDIAPNFDAAASRNFVTDIPEIDGECEVESCIDPADVDDDGHGTHVASTIGSPLNGIGIAGVAPEVNLVNLRAGQDSGYFFLQPTLDAITEAGRIGVDVINMSFYVDPWLFNCEANPADSPEEQAEQRTVIAATQRALDYARSQGVLSVAASGNGSTDLGEPGVDASSPDYPVDAEGDPVLARDREIDNSTCLTSPSEQDGVVTVNATGPSGRKAYYSNFGTEQSDLSAPGGDAYDTPNGRLDPRGLVLAAYPEHLARLSGSIDESGAPTTPMVVRDCEGDVCAYYQYLQGTSMAAPHAAGVAALIVSRYGTADAERPGGLTLAPATTTQVLLGTATDTPCPMPRDYEYRIVRAAGERTLTSTCDGPLDRNGFYGEGVVDALAAVTVGR